MFQRIVFASLGLIPAIILLFLISFKDDALFLLGHEMGPATTLPAVIAMLASLYKPLLFFGPWAWAKPINQRFLDALITPVLLFLPIVCAGLIKGLTFSLTTFLSLLAICVFWLCFCFWQEALSRWLGQSKGLLLWVLLFAWSPFAEYISQIVTALEVKALKPIEWFNWVLPPVEKGFQFLDNLAVTEIWIWPVFLAAICQILFIGSFHFLKPIVKGTKRDT